MAFTFGFFQHAIEGKLQLRLQGGRTDIEGRVEVKFPGSDRWGLVCGDGWSLLEGMVVCRQLGYGYAQGAPSTGDNEMFCEKVHTARNSAYWALCIFIFFFP